MATEVNFEGRKIILPGVYSKIKSGIKNPPISLSFGNAIIIDTGSGANYGGGAGIDGELASGLDTVFPVDNIADFRTMVKGGYWYTLAKPLFEPLSQPGINGVSTVYYVRAATTVAAIMTFSPIGGGINGGTLEFKCRDEGLVGNGSLTSSELRKGYAFKLSAGIQDPAKFVLTVFLGTFTGLASDGFPYGDIAEDASPPATVVTSPELADMAEINAWAAADATFQEFFSISTATEAGDGSLDAADLVTYAVYTLAAGGTETFSSVNLTLVLNAIATLRYTFILSDHFGDEAENIDNDTLLSHVLDVDTSFEKQIFIGGGVDDTKFTQTNGSIPAAEHFNSDRVTVVHGGIKVDSSITPTRSRSWDALYTATLVLGRIAGLEPQTSGSFKTLPISGVQHQLTNSEKKTALQAGVLMVHLDTQLLTPSYTILQAVNTLQNNINMINEDGSTNEISVRRIASQLNLELIINVRRDLLGGEEGPNLNTLTDRTIIDYVAGYLNTKVATETDDNLIIEFKNISVVTDQDAKSVVYEFKSNTPINKFFLTGFMVS